MSFHILIFVQKFHFLTALVISLEDLPFKASFNDPFSIAGSHNGLNITPKV